tara:strand:+ start:54 stop:245 length:192 start_codon:yes stop_codon:yes gene_type:complete
MSKYTLHQRKEIINAFIIQEASEDKPIKGYLSKLVKNRYKHWNFEYLIESIKDTDNLYKTLNI